jgi:hypothetical protein
MVLKDQIYVGMVLQILLRWIDLVYFLMVAARMYVLAIFVPAATSSTTVIRTLDSPATSTWLFDCFSLAYFNGCARNLGLHGIYLGMPPGKYKIALWEKSL